MKPMPRKICVYCASSDKVRPAYVQQAHRLGTLLAQRGWECVNGAGRTGLMGALTDSVLAGGGQVTGVIPQFMVDKGWCHERLSAVVVTPDMHHRKQQMSAMGDALVALPGGCGTLEELLEAITWRQLGIIDKPIVIVNCDGYYTPLTDMLQRCAEQGFMRHSHSQLWTVVGTADEAVRLLVNTFDRDA